jgi:octaprenyl-diphosphate synthase
MIALEELYPDIAADLGKIGAEIAAIASSRCVPLSDAARYLAATPGKRLRPGLLLLAARALGYSGPRCIVAGAVVEVLHAVSLAHDDVIDEADIRRGTASARALWGNRMAVLLGDHLLAGAFKRLIESGDTNLMLEIANAAREMCLGQIQEIMLAGPDLTEPQYLEIVSAKTASLFAASCRLAAAAADAEEPYRQALDSFGKGFGVAYQIADDVRDLTCAAEEMGKPVARDLAQGQITLPVIYALREGSAAQRAELLACLDGNGRDDADLPRIRKLIADAGGFEYAAARVHGFAEQAVDTLAALPSSPARDCMGSLCRRVLPVPIIVGS